MTKRRDHHSGLYVSVAQFLLEHDIGEGSQDTKGSAENEEDRHGTERALGSDINGSSL